MITIVEEIRAAYRWYHLLMTSRGTAVAGRQSAMNAASYACACLFARAATGRPMAYGPHQHAEALMWTDLTTSQAACGNDDLGRWTRTSLRLLPWESTLLCRTLGHVYSVSSALEIMAVTRLTIQDMVLYYEPLSGSWTDGFTHGNDEALIAGLVHRFELLLDDPESPSADWTRLGREYADGELHRHLGWSQEAKALEVQADGQQAAEVRGSGVPDASGTNDQVERVGPDRRFIPGTRTWPGAHDPDAEHD